MYFVTFRHWLVHRLVLVLGLHCRRPAASAAHWKETWNWNECELVCFHVCELDFEETLHVNSDRIHNVHVLSLATDLFQQMSRMQRAYGIMIHIQEGRKVTYLIWCHSTAGLGTRWSASGWRRTTARWKRCWVTDRSCRKPPRRISGTGCWRWSCRWTQPTAAGPLLPSSSRVWPPGSRWVPGTAWTAAAWASTAQPSPHTDRKSRTAARPGLGCPAGNY